MITTTTVTGTALGLHSKGTRTRFYFSFFGAKRRKRAERWMPANSARGYLGSDWRKASSSAHCKLRWANFWKGERKFTKIHHFNIFLPSSDFSYAPPGPDDETGTALKIHPP